MLRGSQLLLPTLCSLKNTLSSHSVGKSLNKAHLTTWLAKFIFHSQNIGILAPKNQYRNLHSVSTILATFWRENSNILKIDHFGKERFGRKNSNKTFLVGFQTLCEIWQRNQNLNGWLSNSWTSKKGPFLGWGKSDKMNVKVLCLSLSYVMLCWNLKMLLNEGSFSLRLLWFWL